MKFTELLEYDNSLCLKNPSLWEEDILGPTNFDYPAPGHFVFVKDARFLSRFKQAMEKSDFTKLGVVVEEKFYDLYESEWKELENKVAFIATSSSVMNAMVKISRPYYDEKFGSINHIVDGRQMGSASVDPTSWVAQNAFIGEDVRIGANVTIHPGAVIMGRSSIGDGSVIYPNVTIYPHCHVGKGCRIHAGCVVGADGFGYVFENMAHNKIWHIGGVIVEDGVEIGANTTIDCGTFSPTKIGAGSKIDNQVQIGHNGQLGMGVIMCGQSGTAGTAKIGNFCVLGGKAAITNDVELGDGTQVAGMSGVTSDWAKGSKIGGHPARPLNEWMRTMAAIRKLARK